MASTDAAAERPVLKQDAGVGQPRARGLAKTCLAGSDGMGRGCTDIAHFSQAVTHLCLLEPVSPPPRVRARNPAAQGRHWKPWLCPAGLQVHSAIVLLAPFILPGPPSSPCAKHQRYSGCRPWALVHPWGEEQQSFWSDLGSVVSIEGAGRTLNKTEIKAVL